MDEWVVGKMDG